MAIIHCDNTTPRSLHADICIVGAGAAGITLACELAGTSRTVLMLEAGGLATNPALSSEFAGVSNFPHPEPSLFREFALGGTTKLWGGRCVPFDPIDFEYREHIPNSGWPISYDDVARYYHRALKYCDAGAFEFSIEGSMRSPRPSIYTNSASGLFFEQIERYSLPTHFGSRYRNILEKTSNITVLLNSRCLSLLSNSNRERITSAEIINIDGERRRIFASTYIIATGGIETPRLLFASDPKGPGLGNERDLVGRFYSCHFESTCAKLISNKKITAFGFEKTRDGIYCRRKIQILPNAQKCHRLMNTTFRLHFTNYADANHHSSIMSAIYLAKTLLRKEYQQLIGGVESHNTRSANSKHLMNVLCGLPQIAKFGIDWALSRYIAHRKLPYTLVANSDGSFPLELNSEQAAIKSSRITPVREVDSFGVRRVAVDWRVRAEDLDSAYRALKLLKYDLAEHTAARLEVNEDLVWSQIQRSPPIKGHHIGTARMAATPREGVVDADCKVFGQVNLFVAGSAVFPTSSHANPTLTIVALAIRLAEHLIKN
jgi:choline dehydrogenase-like flavoprotein